MESRKDKITAEAIEIIKKSPNGIRYSELVRKLQETFPEIPVNTIHGSLWRFKTQLPKEIYQPARNISLGWLRKTMCLIFGIGLVLFDSSNPNNPQFEIKVRALKHEPDMFYVNKYIKLIEDELFGE